MNRVLVLLAAHNGKPWLADQVSTILAQEGVEMQLVIGDDCSSDGCLDALTTDSTARDICIHRFKIPAGGAGQSFLRLLRESRLENFDFVAFSDQDDIWCFDKLKRAIGSLEYEGAEGYSASVTAFWPDGTEKILSQSSVRTELDFFFEGAGQGCTFVLRAKFAREIQQFVEENHRLLIAVHYHDWLIYALARALDKSWVFDSRPSMKYRQHGGNDTGARGSLTGVRKRITLIKSGWYANQIQQIIDAVSMLGNKSVKLPEDFLKLWSSERSVVRRLKLSSVLIRSGRRRFSDRAILAFSALAGWI